jgi:DNA polymerase-3 subunit chi
MSRVDFYVLSASGEIARQQFACRLAEKAYKLEHAVHIHAASSESAQRLDDLLWTFRDGSFVPHEVLGQAAPEAPITIGYGEGLPNERDLLINLGDIAPEEAGSFPRVAEIVTADEDSKSRSRQRFIDYREQGHTLDTHNL